MNNDLDRIIHTLLEKYGFFDSEKCTEIDIPIGFIYNFGPYIAMSERYKEVSDKLSRHNKIFSYMQLCAALCKNGYGTCAEVKKSIKETVMESAKLKDPVMIDVISNKAKGLISYIRDYQYKHNILESAMINTAPIVPYAGENIKKTWIGDEDGKVMNRSTSELIYASEFSNRLKETSDWVSLANHYFNKYAFHILQHTDYTVVPGTDIRIDRLLQRNNDHPEDEAVKFYYFLAYAIFSKMESETAISYLDSVASFPKKVFESTDLNSMLKAMHSQIEIDPEMTANEFWDQMGMTEDDYYKIDELVDHANAKDEYEITFDIQQMISFIYNHRYMVCDEYTNRRFLDEAKDVEVGNVSYYRDNMMSVLVNNKYLVIPYLDIARDYTMHLLCMDREGQIFIKDEIKFD